MNRREFLTGAAVSVAGVITPAGAGESGQRGVGSGGVYDVAVMGGGPAGVCAAIAAARNGAKTLVVERGNCLGGMATRGLVGPFMTCYDKNGRNQIIRGLFEEIVERLVAKDGAIHPNDCRAGTAFTSWIKIGHDHCTPFEPECLKLVLDEKTLVATLRRQGAFLG